MEGLLKDLRFSIRTLLKNPLVTLVAVLSLGLGIGANTTIFTLINAVLLNPLPVEEAERLVSVYTYDERQAGGPFGSHLPSSFPNFEDYRDNSTVFSHLVAYQNARLAVIVDGEPEEVLGEAVSEGYFDMLGIEPTTGRFFGPDENSVEGRAPVVVLSHSFWMRRFAGDPGVLGRTLTINAQPFEIIGVGPAGFTGTFLANTPELWVPMTMHDQIFTGPQRAFFDRRRALMFWLMGRLAPEVTVEQAESALQALAASLAQEYPDANQGRSIALLPLTQANIAPHQRGTFEMAGVILMSVVALVLLIACANVAHLLMVRAESRRREITVRLALGSRRFQLIRQLLTEGFLLAFAGAACGLAVAHWGRDLLWSLRPPFLAHAYPDLSFDAPVLGLTFLLAVATALIFGVLPAWRASNPDLATILRGRTEQPGLSRLYSSRSLLVIFQVALSMVALIVSGLFVLSLRQAQSTDPGFDSDRLAVLAYNLGTQGYDTDRGLQFHRRALELARSVPGVETAALATNRPLSQQFLGFMRSVISSDRDVEDPQSGTLITVDSVSPQYFDTFGIPLVEGRVFTDADREDSLRVAVVNREAARAVWPGREPIGQRFTLYGTNLFFEVVGVVDTIKYRSMGESATPYIYMPTEQNYDERVHVYIRTAGEPGAVLETVRRELRALDPGLPLTHLSTMSRVIDESLWAQRLGALLLGLFGLLALVMAAIGSYGVLSYSVSQRNRELGIRMALGAEPRTVVKLVLVQGMKLVAIGIAMGWIVTFFFSRVLERLLFGVGANDPLVFAVTALILATIAFLANLLPAFRATAIDPVKVLRTE